MSSLPGRVEEAVGTATNVLLLAPDPAADGACVELLTGRPSHGERVVSVALARTLDDWVRVWERQADDLPSRVAFLAAGDSRRSTAATGTVDLSQGIDPVVVSDPYDLAMSLGGALAEFDDGPTVVCFHSITSLLAETSTETAAGFLRSLTRRLRTDGTVAHAHFHMDPGAHDEATVERLRPLFDAVVEHRDGGWSVSVRRDEEEPPGTADGTDPNGPSSIAAGTGIEGFDGVCLPRSLDTVLDLLSSARRRAVLYYALDGQDDDAIAGTTVDLDRLVDYVAERECGGGTDVDRTAVRTSLVHGHLPKLDGGGVVDYDRDAGTVRYHENPALWACVKQAAALEAETREW